MDERRRLAQYPSGVWLDGKSLHLLVSTNKLVAAETALGQHRAQRGTFDGAVSGKRHRSHGAVWLGAGKRKVVAGANDLESEHPESA